MKIVSRLSMGAAGLGAWIGMMVGLSTSPVVAVTLGAITPFAIGFVSWFSTRSKSAASDDPPAAALYLLAVGVFGWAAVFAMLAGLWIRTHDLLSPTPKQIVARWMAAGLTKAEAVAIARGEAGSPAGKEGPPDGEGKGAFPNPARSSVLFTAFAQARTEAGWSNLELVIQNGSSAEIVLAFGNFKTLKPFAELMEKSAASETEKRQFAQSLFRLLEETKP